MARCQLNDVCRMRLIYNQTGFAKLFDNQQNLIVVIIVIHLARSLEQSQMIQFCWDLNGSILLSFSIIIRDKSILLFILVPTFLPDTNGAIIFLYLYPLLLITWLLGLWLRRWAFVISRMLL